MEFSEKQIQILEVAERLFAGKGYAGTSVRDIAQKAGVNVAMISYYFGSKERMLEALLHYRSDSMYARLEPLLTNKSLNPQEKLDRIVEEYVKKFWHNRQLHRAILREYYSHESRPLYKFIVSARKRQVTLLGKIIAQGQQEKIFRKDIDVPFLFATLSGITRHVLFARDFYQDTSGLTGTAREKDMQLLERLERHLKSTLTQIVHEDNV